MTFFNKENTSSLVSLMKRMLQVLNLGAVETLSKREKISNSK